MGTVAVIAAAFHPVLLQWYVQLVLNVRYLRVDTSSRSQHPWHSYTALELLRSSRGVHSCRLAAHSHSTYYPPRDDSRNTALAPLELYWVIPENTFHVQTCAVHVCLGMHERCRVYTFSPDVGPRLEKTCMREWCTHGIAFSQDLATGVKKMA